MTIMGGCLCGRCSYATDAEPINVRACHCHACQRATGAPFYARVLVPLDTVTMAGPIGWHHSSPELRRGFCQSCGTTMFSERESANAIGLTMGSLNDPDSFSPTMHIWTSCKQAWVEIGSGVPQFEEAPPG